MLKIVSKLIAHCFNDIHSILLHSSHEGQVRHYHIKEDSDKNHFISEKHRFPTITELIEYHKLNGGGKLYTILVLIIHDVI